jgi:hypothetical protein
VPVHLLVAKVDINDTCARLYDLGGGSARLIRQSDIGETSMRLGTTGQWKETENDQRYCRYEAACADDGGDSAPGKTPAW